VVEPYLYLGPAIVLIGLVILYPLIVGIGFSFQSVTLLRPEAAGWVGLDNFVALWSDRYFWIALENTFVWTFGSLFFQFFLGLGLALLLNQKLRGRTFYRLILVLPWAVPTFVTVFGWRFMLADGGVINTALEALHLPAPLWLEDTFLQRFAAIMVNTWCGVPFMMVSLLGGLQSIDTSLYEAAEMDGASAWQRFRYVTLPGLRSVSSTVVLLGIIWTFNQFAVIFLLFGDTAPEAQILVTWAYYLGFGQQPPWRPSRSCSASGTSTPANTMKAWSPQSPSNRWSSCWRSSPSASSSRSSSTTVSPTSSRRPRRAPSWPGCSPSTRRAGTAPGFR
jgi:arabinogalactan oligomer/maltooligosaccharide transport system permease protein